MSGVWRQEQPMHQKRERFGSGVMDSCVFVAGGFTEEGRPTSHVEVPPADSSPPTPLLLSYATLPPLNILVYEPLSY